MIRTITLEEVNELYYNKKKHKNDELKVPLLWIELMNFFFYIKIVQTKNEKSFE